MSAEYERASLIRENSARMSHMRSSPRAMLARVGCVKRRDMVEKLQV